MPIDVSGDTEESPKRLAVVRKVQDEPLTAVHQMQLETKEAGRILLFSVVLHHGHRTASNGVELVAVLRQNGSGLRVGHLNNVTPVELLLQRLPQAIVLDLQVDDVAIGLFRESHYY